MPTSLSSIWTVVGLQALCTLILLAAIFANFIRVLKMRADLAKHRINLEHSLAHLESELQSLRERLLKEETRDGEAAAG